jgi:hypothetical protein
MPLYLTPPGHARVRSRGCEVFGPLDLSMTKTDGVLSLPPADRGVQRQPRYDLAVHVDAAPGQFYRTRMVRAARRSARTVTLGSPARAASALCRREFAASPVGDGGRGRGYSAAGAMQHQVSAAPRRPARTVRHARPRARARPRSTSGTFNSIMVGRRCAQQWLTRPALAGAPRPRAGILLRRRPGQARAAAAGVPVRGAGRRVLLGPLSGRQAGQVRRAGEPRSAAHASSARAERSCLLSPVYSVWTAAAGQCCWRCR